MLVDVLVDVTVADGASVVEVVSALSAPASSATRAAAGAGGAPPSIHTVSGGGGLPIPYEPGEERVSLDEHYRLWRDTQDRLAADFGHPVSLEIEPGRYIVAESGYLVTEIRAIKTMGANTFYVVDAGFNNLARPVLYGAYHPMSVVAGDGRGVPDIVDDGRTGLLTPVGEPAPFAKAVASLLDDPGRRRSMGHAAQRHVLANHDLGAATARLNAVLAELAP